MNNKIQIKTRKFINILLSSLLIVLLPLTLYLEFNNFDITMMFSPIIFLGLLLIMPNIKISLARMDYIAIFIVFLMALRYIPYPILFCILRGEEFFTLSYSYGSFFLFIFEEIVTITLLNYGLRRTLYVSVNNEIVDNKNSKNSWLIGLLFFISLFFYFRFPSIAANYQFIFDVSVSAAAGSDFDSIIESVGYVVIDATRLLTPLLIINKAYSTYKKQLKQKKYVLLSFMACLIPMLLIKNMNRGSSFFASLVYIWLVLKLYGWKQCKVYLMATILGVFSLLAVVSSVKHAMGLSSEGLTLTYIYKMLESYTLGIETIRVGLYTNAVNESINPFLVLYNDIFSSLPILNRFSDSSMRYTSLFNAAYYTGVYNKGDALAPLLTNMIYVFGPIGILVPFFMIILAIKSYFVGLRQSSINKVFVFVYLAVVIESGRIGSLSATIATLVWVVLPLAIFVKIQDKVRIKK